MYDVQHSIKHTIITVGMTISFDIKVHFRLLHQLHLIQQIVANGEVPLPKTSSAIVVIPKIKDVSQLYE